jgi:hypothetical protein
VLKASEVQRFLQFVPVVGSRELEGKTTKGGIGYQRVKCATRGKRTLDHLYSTHRDAYKAHPPFGKSDHNSIFLIPAYKQKLKQEAPVTRSIKKWSDEADAKLQDCFASTD